MAPPNLPHPDAEAANAIAEIVMKHSGWLPLNERYGIANDVLRWLDAHRPGYSDGLRAALKAIENDSGDGAWYWAAIVERLLAEAE